MSISVGSGTEESLLSWESSILMERTNKPGGSGNTSFFGGHSRSSVATVLLSDRDALGDALSVVEVVTKNKRRCFTKLVPCII